MNLTFRYNKQKTIQALRYHFISRREIKVMIIAVNVFALLAAVLYFLKKVTPSAFLLSSFLWIVLMLMFWILMPGLVYRRSGIFKEEVTMALDEEELAIRVKEYSRSFPWNSFSDWMETPHFFHLYFNSRAFFLLPKDAFGEDSDEIRRRFSRKIKLK